MEPKNVKSAGSVDEAIGLKISQLRTSQGVTRQALADLLGVTHQQLQKYERGVNRVSASRLLEIARHLNTPILYFFEDINEPVEDGHMNRQRLCVEVMQDFARIKKPHVQEAVRALVRSIANDNDALKKKLL